MATAGVLSIASVLLVACVQTHVRNITGPSGQSALFITCADPGVCYELAGRHCPTGYDLNPSKVDVHSVVVTCRQAIAAQYSAPAPALQPVAARDYVRPASAPQESAPMVTDPWQPNYAPPPPPPPRDQASDMASPRPIGSGGPDLGY